MRQTVLLLVFTLLVVEQSTALPTWDQLESVLEKNDNITATDSITDPASHELIINAIETATERIRRNLAEEMDGLLEKLPQIIQATPAPLAPAAPAPVAPVAPVAPAAPAPATSQGRTAEVQLGQQLVWAAAGEQPVNAAPPKPRPRPLPPPKAAVAAAPP